MLLFLALAAQISKPLGTPELPAPEVRQTVVAGWRDEMDSLTPWGPLNMENKARVTAPLPGLLELSLGQVPGDWPYAYQWSGVTRDMSISIARYPILMARVMAVQGYAHLDIDVLNDEGKAVRTLRSSTLNGPGVTKINLVESLDPAFYRLRLRLIVGGPNSGCAATYGWLRFFRPQDAKFIEAHPDFEGVTSPPPMLR